MVLVCLPTHTRNPAIRFTPLQCEHCTHPTSILLPNGQLSVFTVCEPVLSSSVRALPKATVRAGMVLTGAEYCYRAFSQCLFTVQEWGLLLKSGRRSGFATAQHPHTPIPLSTLPHAATTYLPAAAHTAERPLRTQHTARCHMRTHQNHCLLWEDHPPPTACMLPLLMIFWASIQSEASSP